MYGIRFIYGAGLSGLPVRGRRECSSAGNRTVWGCFCQAHCVRSLECAANQTLKRTAVRVKRSVLPMVGSSRTDVQRSKLVVLLALNGWFSKWKLYERLRKIGSGECAWRCCFGLHLS